MSDGRFYRWIHDGVVDRRGVLSFLVGIGFGWTGATLVDEDGPVSGGVSGNESDRGPRSVEGVEETTDSPPSESEATVTAEPTPEVTTTSPPPSTTTTEPTATATPEGENLGSNLDISSRGFGDQASYQVIYSIHNRNDVAVVVDFEATVSLDNGETLLQEATATIDPGQAATDEFAFEGYDSSPTGWDFQVQAVRRV